MPTNKKRIIISLPKKTEKALGFLAVRDQLPTATRALRLIETALEIEEDQVLDHIANKRDQRGAKFVSHERAWL